MTEKTKDTKETTETKEVTQKEFLENQVKYLNEEVSRRSKEVESVTAEFNQYVGARNFAVSQLNAIKGSEEVKK